MADGHHTSGARARKRAVCDDRSWFDESPLGATTGPPSPPRASADSFVDVFALTAGPRAAAPYERFVDRHVVESLRAFARGARRRANGERHADLLNASASKSFGKHRKLKRILDEIVELRPEDVTTAREAKRWSARGRALRDLFDILRRAQFRPTRHDQRQQIRAALRCFEATLPSASHASRGRPAGRPIDRSFASMAITGAKHAVAQLNGQKPGNADTFGVLREMESAFAAPFVGYFVEVDGARRALTKLDAIAECTRPALYAMLRRRRFPAIRKLEANWHRKRAVADDATLAIYFIARWYGVGQKTAKRAMRGVAIQVRPLLDRVVVRQSEHSRGHESTHSADAAERSRRAPDRRQSRATPEHDPPSVRRAPRPLADRRADRESREGARTP